MRDKTIAIHQPNYIPWLGFFYKVAKCDIFVFHDDVQFSKKGMHNFHYIKSSNNLLRLKIPVLHKHGQLINEIVTKDELNWQNNHLNLIEENYRKAPYFKEVYEDFSLLINKKHTSLSELNIDIIKFISHKFGLFPQFINASELNLTTFKEEKVIDLIKNLEGTIYYSGIGAKAYQTESNFQACGIRLKYSTFNPFTYPQQFEPYESNVCVLDYLMNCGYDWDRVIQNQINNDE